MVISATELKSNLGKYLELIDTENILITKNGKVIAELSKPRTLDKIAILESLIGIAKPKDDFDVDMVKEERLSRL